jgi:hypothetical protein
MIGLSSIFLVFLICVLSSLCRGSIKTLFGLFGIMSVCSMIAFVFISEADHDLYFIIGTLLLVCVAEIVPHIKPITKTSVLIQGLCFVGISVNLTGWLLWVNYLPPLSYDLMWLGIYLVALGAMFDRRANELRDDGLFNTTDHIRYGFNAMRHFATEKLRC